jgi:hypothetical protein
LNSREPDFNSTPNLEPSVNHFLLSLDEYPKEKRESLGIVRARNLSAKKSSPNKPPKMKIKLNFAAGKVESVRTKPAINVQDEGGSVDSRPKKKMQKNNFGIVE